ncbi:ABC-2 family transporter [Halopolyspora algeriensis]|uniref:ABC-2 family transporter n=1 Tax=Halopolyspora algeriensis TaxID=1500506 RepID=A0A368VVT2_9ACTN|nr:ABC transporter permease subunit [Halopolyspora algeriensis]RCW45313.1 ABC-2 family transporter [Halopolyspora algeriensis]TQM47353.1 ABC-2 family transporter [Halopolyspora algeriensis]
MGGLVKAEFRKIFTVNLWWALLIPVAVLSFGAGWIGTAFGSIEQMQEAAGRSLPTGLLTVSMSTNYSTIFAALFGALAVAGEHRHKSITTTYLTGNPRGAVLGAKLIAYTNIGLLYGLVNVLSASIGGLLGAGLDGFGNPVDWFTVGGAGLLAMVLWTLLGVGFGALVTNSIVAVLVLVAYKFVIEFILSVVLLGSEIAGFVAYLPGAASNGIVGNLAVPIFISAVAGDSEPYVQVEAFQVLHFFFGGTYGHPWWLSLLTFLGYTAAFVLGGWLVSRRRDIT